MYDGMPTKSNKHIAINYKECIKKIKDKGMHFSLKRFLTALLMVNKVSDFKFNEDERHMVVPNDTWSLSNETLQLYVPQRSSLHHRKLEDKIVAVYSGNQINHFDDNTHYTRQLIKNYVMVLSSLIALCGIPMALGWWIVGIEYNALFSTLGVVLFGVGLFMILPSIAAVTMLAKHRIIGKSKKVTTFVTMMNGKINAKREEIMYRIAEDYVFENKGNYNDVEAYIKKHDLNSKSLMELLELDDVA